ncbi:hypothetical protein AAU61_11365 [Desulfocarbo indianensis]|nr:hypothetical protein AAU61_11365 [Desulfocarbo indianensis]
MNPKASETASPGKPPDNVINRTNQISWNDWNKPANGTIYFQNLGLSGVTYNNPDGVSRQEILARMQRWEALDLVREPNNPHDANAVAVLGGMGQIGYIEKAFCWQIAPMMDAGWSVLSKLSALYGGDGKSFGGKVEAHLSPPEGAITIRSKIVGISGKNEDGDPRSEIAEEAQVGDLVDLSLGGGLETDAQHVYVDLAHGANFGRLDKKNASIFAPLLENGYSCIASVEETGLDDQDKPMVVITATAWKAR